VFKYFKYKKIVTDKTVFEFRGDAEDVTVNVFQDEQVVSIYAEDEDAIYALVAQQEDAIECQEIEKDSFVEKIKDSARYKRILDKVSKSYEDQMLIITDRYPSVERETWDIQLKQAYAFLESNDENDAPFLKTLAEDEDTNLEDFANSVVQKAKLFEKFSANALASKRRFKKQLLSEIGV